MQGGAVMRDFIQRNAIVMLSSLLAVSVASSIVLAVQVYGFSVGPFEIEGLRDKAERFEGEAKAAVKVIGETERLRAEENAQARASFTAISERCEKRITTARDAAAAIEEIVHYGQGNAPGAASSDDERGDFRGDARSVVPADQLRRIVGQTARP